MRLALHQFDPKVSEAGKSDIVLIHGTGSSAEMWVPQVDLLTSIGHRCFVIDLRGHGKSPEPGEHTDLAVHMADVIETVENSPIKFPCVFIGHSLGAIISVTLAEQRPELVSLVFAAGFPGRVLPAISLAFKLFMAYGYTPLKAKNWHHGWAFRPRTLIQTEKHALEQIVANFGGLDFVTNLPQVKCRVHIAAGRFDPVAPSFYARRVHQALPTSTFKMFEWAGHNFMDTHPKTFNRWLLEGLTDIG
ncbi:MAG: alpha/beta hydrolase [Cyanobacteria bacterium SZAS TMP-1]|nr:alpha/beta hydrolase [Cyanobacteria bacterium SZAS TMP-1]